CTVARLMAVMGISGVLRGKKGRTNNSRETGGAGDRVNPQVGGERTDPLWGGDFSYVTTKEGLGFVGFILFVFFGGGGAVKDQFFFFSAPGPSGVGGGRPPRGWPSSP
ncbi:hypothetical protein AP219_26170, partial [Escherichia coli]